MNRNTGILGAIILAIAAIFGYSGLPSGRGEPSAATESSKRSETAALSQQETASPCREIEDAIADFFAKDSVVPPFFCPGGLSQSKAGAHKAESANNPTGVRYIIATLPDPVHTHFPLLFDRLTEALQQGAQDQGYNYDDSWLPWEDETRAYGSLADQDAAEKRVAQQEEQPGVLVFRKALPATPDWPSCTPKQSPGKDQPPCPSADEIRPYREGLIVFVVAENPTGGINLNQFQNAVCWIQSLEKQTKDSKLGILGPYFSGSFPSLARAITANNLLTWPSPAPGCSPKKTGDDAPKSAEASAPRQVASAPSAPTSGPENASAAPAGQSKVKVEAATKPLTIFSGSVTSLSGINWFNNFLLGPELKLGSKPAGIFHSFQENDDLMIDRYCQYLNILGYDTGKVVILSEDETAYGARSDVSGEKFDLLPDGDNPPEGSSNATHGPLYLFYPRDIAALRSAYETEAPASLGSSQTQSPNSGLRLPFKLAEPSGRQRDTIRSYGGAQTPLSQEAVLLGVTKLLSSHGIQFIVLRSSNTLDEIFLTQFFSKAYPQARVVLTSSDLLFRRGSETAGFRGTLTLSTYPLFTWQQDWTFWQSYESRHSHRTFSQDSAEGLYLATRYLIDGELYSDGQKLYTAKPCDKSNCFQLKTGSDAIVIQDYAPPFWLLPQASAPKDFNRPPTWISVIGSEQFWPVAVVDDSLLEGSTARPPASTLPWLETSAPSHAVDLPLLLPMTLLIVVNVVWTSGHFLGCRLASHKPHLLLAPARFLLNFAPMRARHRQQQKLIFVGGLVLATVAVMLTSLTGLFTEGGTFERRLLVALAGAMLLVSAVFGFFSYCRNCRTVSRKAKHWLRELLWFLCLSIVSGLAFWWAVPHHLVRYNTIPTYWRSLNPLNGVAPVIPMFLVMVGLYGWFWFSLSGLALFNGDRPRLPRYPKVSVDKDGTTISYRMNLGRQIEQFAAPLRKHYGTYLLVLVTVILVCKLLFFTALPEQGSFLGWMKNLFEAFGVRSLGTCWYGGIFFVYLSISIGLILLDGWRLLFTWGRLRQLLAALDELPLRRTLDSLSGFSWKTVWEMSGSVCEQRDRLIARQVESLRHLQNQLDDFPQDTLAEMETVEELRRRLAICDAVVADYSGLPQTRSSQLLCPVSSVTAQGHFAKLPKTQSELASAATAVLNKFLVETWQKEKHSLIRKSSSEKPEKSKGEKATTHSPEYVRAAEEFVALPYLGFIQNILGRIRTMALGMMILFVMAAFSVASYPFDPRPELGGMFLVVFLLIAGIVILVYAQMHRDATLSNITNTNPGELGSEFWMKIIALGAGPLLALLTTLFPQIATFITSWLQPGVQAIK